MNNESKSPKHVLVIEDEEDFAALIASVLRDHGYDVTVAGDAQEGHKEVHERIPDLITLDLQMPQRSGLHFYREIKSRPTLEHIPVVVITGVTRDDREMETFVRSFLEVDHLPSPEAYLKKPFDNQELVNVVERALAGV